ncbi:hypothetical protein CRENBAI_013286, partial [Crenichthys baileyi]
MERRTKENHPPLLSASVSVASLTSSGQPTPSPKSKQPLQPGLLSHPLLSSLLTTFSSSVPRPGETRFLRRIA